MIVPLTLEIRFQLLSGKLYGFLVLRSSAGNRSYMHHGPVPLL